MNEPVAWIAYDEFGDFMLEAKPEGNYPWQPLYTHPAKELNAGGEPVKNATYWKRQYNEMSALNDRLKSSLYHANEQIKYLELHPAKTLTDEEIKEALACLEMAHDETMDYIKLNNLGGENNHWLVWARAILRKAQEK